MDKKFYDYICSRPWPEGLTWSLVERLDVPVPYYVLVFFADTFNNDVLAIDEVLRVPQIINDIMFKSSMAGIKISLAKESVTPIGHING